LDSAGIRGLILPQNSLPFSDARHQGASNGIGAWKSLQVLAAVSLLAVGLSALLLMANGGVIADLGWTWRFLPGGAVIEHVDPSGAAAGVLQAGDLLLSLNRDPRAAHAGPRPWVERMPAGTLYALQVSRSGDTLTFHIPMGSRRDNTRYARHWGNLLVGLTYWIVAYFVARYRSDNVWVRCGAVSSYGLAAMQAGISLIDIQWTAPGWEAGVYAVLRAIHPIPLFFAFLFLSGFPHERNQTPLTRRRSWRIAVWVFAGLTVLYWSALVPYRLLPVQGLEMKLTYLSGLLPLQRASHPTDWLRYSVQILFLIALLAAACANYLMMRTPQDRFRMEWLWVGCFLSVFPSLANALFQSAGIATTPAGVQMASHFRIFDGVANLTAAIFPLLLIHAVLRHRVLGIRHTIALGIRTFLAKYLLRISIAAPVAYVFILILRAPRESMAAILEQRPALVALLGASLLMFLFEERILQSLARRFFQPEIRRQAMLEGLPASLNECESYEEIGAVAQKSLRDGFQADVVGLVANDPDSGRLRWYSPHSRLNGADHLWGPLNKLPQSEGLLELPVELDDELRPLMQTQLDTLRKDGFDLLYWQHRLTPAAAHLYVAIGERLPRSGYSDSDIDSLRTASSLIAGAWRRLEMQRALAREITQRDAAASAGRLKDDFLAHMSHELRTPLGGMIGAAHLLSNSGLSEEQLAYVDLMRSSGASLLHVVNNLLELSKLESGGVTLSPSPCDPASLIESVATAFRPECRAKGLHIWTYGGPGLPAKIVCDESRLRQVVLQLVSNAVNFTEHGSLWLRASCPQPGWLEVAVQDTGVGISPSAQSRIFEAFELADRSPTRRHGGVGLGLTIARRLAHLMNGEISLTSTPGKGSEFLLRVPVEPLATDAPLPASKGPAFVLCPHEEQSQILLDYLHRLGYSPCAQDSPVAGSPPQLAVYLADTSLHTLLPPNASVVWLGDEPVPGREPLLTYPVSCSLLEKTLSSLDPPPAGAPLRPGLKILFADDNRIGRKVVTTMLEKLGCVVTPVSDGASAIAAAQTDSFDAILMDWQMPGMDGLQATRAIRSLDGPAAAIPIIALTANALPGDRETCLAAGMDDYLTKPIGMDLLSITLARWTNPESRPN
jgi:signal transduction histidine kinase/CheY-like chemotaxis protein